MWQLGMGPIGPEELEQMIQAAVVDDITVSTVDLIMERGVRPAGSAERVEYVVEARLPGARVVKGWTVMWSAVVGEDASGMEEAELAEFAAATFEGMSGAPGGLEWRLVRRTSVIRDEVISPDPGESVPWAEVKAQEGLR